jgi:hypothetical protein
MSFHFGLDGYARKCPRVQKSCGILVNFTIMKQLVLPEAPEFIGPPPQSTVTKIIRASLSLGTTWVMVICVWGVFWGAKGFPTNLSKDSAPEINLTLFISPHDLYNLGLSMGCTDLALSPRK